MACHTWLESSWNQLFIETLIKCETRLVYVLFWYLFWVHELGNLRFNRPQNYVNTAKESQSAFIKSAVNDSITAPRAAQGWFPWITCFWWDHPSSDNLNILKKNYHIIRHPCLILLYLGYRITNKAFGKPPNKCGRRISSISIKTDDVFVGWSYGACQTSRRCRIQGLNMFLVSNIVSKNILLWNRDGLWHGTKSRVTGRLWR